MENRCDCPDNDPLMIEYHGCDFMQAGGMVNDPLMIEYHDRTFMRTGVIVNDHLVHCFRHGEVGVPV